MTLMMAMAMKASIRLASKQDVPLITKLVHQFAEVSVNASTCTATDSNLLELLFNHPPFEGPTVFLLEVSDSQCAEKDAKKVMLAPSGDEEASVAKNSISVLEPPPTQMVAKVKNIRPRPGGRGRVSNRGRDLSEDGEECSSPLADDVEIELFRSTSNVNYRGKFLKDFKVGTTSLEVVESSSDANMEEPVLEVFKSTTDVTLDDVVDVYASVQALALTSGGKGSKSSSSKGESHLDVTNLAQIIGELTLGASVEDPDSEGFRVSCETGVSPRIVVGWIHVFPNYSTYLAKAGLYIEALYIRKPYRRLGLGKMLLKKVAQEAVKRGTKRMEWAVVYSNFPAINFCENMGAQIKPGFQRCVLDREALLNCKP